MLYPWFQQAAQKDQKATTSATEKARPPTEKARPLKRIFSARPLNKILYPGFQQAIGAPRLQPTSAQRCPPHKDFSRPPDEPPPPHLRQRCPVPKTTAPHMFGLLRQRCPQPPDEPPPPHLRQRCPQPPKEPPPSHLLPPSRQIGPKIMPPWRQLPEDSSKKRKISD